MTILLKDHKAQWEKEAAAAAIQAEREKIADYLAKRASDQKQLDNQDWIIFYELAAIIRYGTYAHPTQEPHP